MDITKRGARIGAAVLVSAALLTAGCGGGSSSKLAASVNGKEITTAKLDTWMKRIEASQNLQGQDKTKFESQMKKQVLENLIEEQIIRQEAEKQKLSVPDKEVDSQFKQILVNSKKNEKEATEELKKQGMTVSDFKDYLKTQLTAQRLFQKITEKTTVTSAEVQKYYESHKNTDFKLPERVNALQIMTDKEETAKKAKAELDKGTDFGTVAKQYSIDPTKDKGGALGIKRKDEVAPAWRDAVFTKKPGETTDVFKANDAYYVVKVVEKYEAQVVPFEQAKTSIEQQVLNEKRTNAFSSWLNGIKKKSDIKKFI